MSSGEDFDILPDVNPNVATTASVPAASAASAATAANVSTQLLDLRGLAKPRTFEGKDTDWDDWAFTFESYCALLGMEEDMQLAVEYNRTIQLSALSVQGKEHAMTLYHHLVQLVQGK